MRRKISVLLSLCLATAVAGQQPAWRNSDLSDPIEILKKVDAATKAVKSVKYKITFRGTGAAESRVANVEGTVFMSGWSDGTPKQFRFEAKIKAVLFGVAFHKIGEESASVGTDSAGSVGVLGFAESCPEGVFG